MIEFEGFMDRFYNPVYFHERLKLHQALRVLCEHMPGEIYEELPDVILFAPEMWQNGVSLPLPHSTDPEAALVYLPPRMEEETQEQNNFTVAHEFAHVALRHYTYSAMMSKSPVEYLDQPNEIAADELVKQWGYELPSYRVRP